MKSALMIKDLALDKELDGKAMSAVRGGSNFGLNANLGNVNAAFGGGFASPAVVVAPVTQTMTQVDLHIPTIQNFGGIQTVY